MRARCGTCSLACLRTCEWRRREVPVSGNSSGDSHAVGLSRETHREAVLMSPVEWAVLSSLRPRPGSVICGPGRACETGRGALLPKLQGEGGSSVSERNWLRSGGSGFPGLTSGHIGSVTAVAKAGHGWCLFGCFGLFGSLEER